VRALGLGVEQYSRGELRSRALEAPSGTRQVPGAPRFSSTQIIVLAASVTLFIAGAIVLLILLFSHSDNDGTEAGAGAANGSIVVTTSPPAPCSVSVDGAPKGILDPGASLTLSGVTVGQHVISIECPGYETFSSTTEVTAQVSFVVAELKKK